MVIRAKHDPSSKGENTMGFWPWSSKTSKQKPAQSPIAAKVIDLGSRLIAHVGVFKIDAGSKSVECWTYRSSGLRAHGQKELALAVPRETDSPPDEPLQFFRSVGLFATQGRLVDVGGLSAFGPLGTFIRREFRGIGYAPAHGMEEVLQDADHNQAESLAMVLLTEQELHAAGRFGLARVLARLGKAARFYPYPLWNGFEIDRTIRSEWITNSHVAQFGAIVTAPGCMPVLQGRRICLRISQSGAVTLVDALSKRRGATLLAPTTAGWDEAPYCSVWTPELSGPTAITRKNLEGGASEAVARPDDIVLGCFIAFLPSESSEGAIALEDGHVAFLSTQSWERLITSLRSGTAFEIDSNDEKLIPFAVRLG